MMAIVTGGFYAPDIKDEISHKNNILIKSCEYYFIQFLFCRNPELLKKEYRGLYDELFRVYEKVYNEEKLTEGWLDRVNGKFMDFFCKESKDGGK